MLLDYLHLITEFALVNQIQSQSNPQSFQFHERMHQKADDVYCKNKDYFYYCFFYLDQHACLAQAVCLLLVYSRFESYGSIQGYQYVYI